MVKCSDLNVQLDEFLHTDTPMEALPRSRFLKSISPQKASRAPSQSVTSSARGNQHSDLEATNVFHLALNFFYTESYCVQSLLSDLLG